MHFSLRHTTIFLHKSTLEPSSIDTRLVWTPIHNGQFPLSLQKKKAHIFSTIKLLNMDTCLIRTIWHVPSASILTSVPLYMFKHYEENYLHLSCCQLVSQQSISCECQYRDDNRCCCPKINTPGIQVLPSF